MGSQPALAPSPPLSVLIITLGQTAKFEGPRPEPLGIGKWESGDTTRSCSGQDGTPRTRVWVGGSCCAPPSTVQPHGCCGLPCCHGDRLGWLLPRVSMATIGGIVHAGQVGCFFMNDESV